MRRRLFRSLTFRLTLLFSLASAAVLLALGFFILNSISRHFVSRDVEILSQQLIRLKDTLNSVKTPEERELMEEHVIREFSGKHGIIVIVKRHDGKILFTKNLDDLPVPTPYSTPGTKYSESFVWSNSHGIYRMITGEFTSPWAEWASGTIFVGLDISYHRTFMAAFFWSLLAGIAIATLTTGFLGWVATRRGLAPLRRLIASASELTASKLDHRLPLEGAPLELEDLARTLNELFARLEEDFKRLSDFSSEIAHELRTPISNLKMQTQVALSRSRTAGEYRDVLSSNAEELDHLTRMVSDMLLLAKADHGLMIPSPERLALETEMASLFEFYAILAETQGMLLEMSGRGEISGDRTMLRRAFGNLLSNAIAYGARNSTIRVDIERSRGSRLTVTVTNRGETIAPRHLAHMFDRFYRIDIARSDGESRVGLGLAITRSIIRAHGGDVRAESANGIIRFIVELPGRS